jgi:hypothetical protein
MNSPKIKVSGNAGGDSKDIEKILKYLFYRTILQNTDMSLPIASDINGQPDM